MTVIQCYEPTNEAEVEVQGSFYQQLQKKIDGTPRHDLLPCDWRSHCDGGE
mgnify:CR=1 FL=1